MLIFKVISVFLCFSVFPIFKMDTHVAIVLSIIKSNNNAIQYVVNQCDAMHLLLFCSFLTHCSSYVLTVHMNRYIINYIM